ncbi:MAG: helical backbone metal receptor [Bryobacterales bacterium]|nr:helical backbone metal receptor [Bryobacterales bacterium]
MRRLLLVFLCAGAGFGQPSRIISTSPGITEILFAIGAGGSVVGVTSYCDFPEQVRRLPKIGSYSRPDPEKIAALRPDLVILYGKRGDLANRLAAMRLPSLVVEMNSLHEVMESIARIGAATGRSENALRLVAQIRAQLEAARQSAPAQRPKTLILVARQPGTLGGLIAAGPASWLGELAEAAGAENLIPAGGPRYPRISLEMVVSWNPDLILDASGTMTADGDEERHRQAALRPWLERADLKAVREGRIVVFSDELFVRPGPRVPQALARISEAIHRGKR